MNAIEKLQRIMPPELDCAILFSAVNRRYFTGFDSSDGILFLTREKAYFIVDFRYIEAARAAVSGCEVLLLTDMGEQLRGLALENRVRTAGVEAYELPLADFFRLRKCLPDVRFDEGNALNNRIDQLRMIKTPEEIARIRKAQEITDAAFAHVLPLIKPGVCERDLALEIEFFMKKNGASGPSFDLIVISGEKTSLPHGVPGDRKVCGGDFVTMDIGAVYKGYCSDMTRTVAVGGVTQEQRKVYDTVLRAQLESEKAIRAGKVCRDIDSIARTLLENEYPGCFGHGLGHSVGLEIHEEPRLSPSCGAVLQADMLMTVEPGVYLEKKFGVRIEDLVVVTQDGCDILTQSPKDLIIL